MSNLAENLRKLLSEAKLSERELSRRTGVVQPVIHRILNGITQNPTIETVQALANYFLVSLSELTGEVPLSQSRKEKQSFEHQGWGHVPILVNDQIREWFKSGKINSGLLKNIPVDFVPSSKAFAFELVNDVMSPIFSQKDLVIVDPAKELKHNKYVLVEENNNMEVRVLVIEASGTLYTKSFIHPMATETKRDSILGTIVQTKRSMED